MTREEFIKNYVIACVSGGWKCSSDDMVRAAKRAWRLIYREVSK